jgi:methylmalonyl-CoA mutase
MEDTKHKLNLLGVYIEIKDDKSFEKAKQIADIFAKQEGRPRIMI